MCVASHLKSEVYIRMSFIKNYIIKCSSEFRGKYRNISLTYPKQLHGLKSEEEIHKATKSLITISHILQFILIFNDGINNSNCFWVDQHICVI